MTRLAVLVIALAVASCSSGGTSSDGAGAASTAVASTATPTTTAGAGTGPPSPATGAPVPASAGDTVVASPCELLTTADFAAAGKAIAGPGVPLDIGLATTSSAGCQWSGDGTWDLLVGAGGGARAYEFDRGFFDDLDDVDDLDAGDAGYILDREAEATPEDYDHEAGVVIGDVYFTLSTTDDEGAEATEELATLVAERLVASG